MLRNMLMNPATGRHIFVTRLLASALITASALSSSISCAQADTSQQSSKNENLPPQQTGGTNKKTLQEFQIKQRSQARTSGNFGPYTVSNEKTCFDARRKQERACADFEDHYDSGESDGQAWFNRGKRYDNKGRLLSETERFSLIDAGYRKHCAGETPTKSGSWTLVSYNKGFSAQLDGWQFRPDDLASLEDWAKYVPDSSGGQWAVARYWYLYGWKARSSRAASDVSESAWKLFRERLAKADESLTLAETRPIGCPLVSALRLELMLMQSDTKGEMRKSFNDAQKKYPGYHPLYFAMARRYEPRWGGSEREFERFAQDVIKLASNPEGVGMYVRLYVNADEQNGLRLNKETLKPKWKTFQSGFEKLLKLYPNSETLVFQYIDFACRVGDSKTYRRLRPRAIGFEESYAFREPLDACDAAYGWTEVR